MVTEAVQSEPRSKSRRGRISYIFRGADEASWYPVTRMGDLSTQKRKLKLLIVPENGRK